MKTKYKVGQEIEVLEMYRANSRYITVKIIEIKNKKLYNLYLCENVKTGVKITFTDKKSRWKNYKEKKWLNIKQKILKIY